MKIYDKEIYKKQESMRMTIIIVISFLMGFIVGYFATTYGIVGNTTNNINVVKNNSIVIDK